MRLVSILEQEEEGAACIIPISLYTLEILGRGINLGGGGGGGAGNRYAP